MLLAMFCIHFWLIWYQTCIAFLAFQREKRGLFSIHHWLRGSAYVENCNSPDIYVVWPIRRVWCSKFKKCLGTLFDLLHPLHACKISAWFDHIWTCHHHLTNRTVILIFTIFNTKNHYFLKFIAKMICLLLFSCKSSEI